MLPKVRTGATGEPVIFSDEENRLLSGLKLKYGCIPFDTMPFASSLIQHIPGNAALYGSIEKEGRDCEFFANYI